VPNSNFLKRSIVEEQDDDVAEAGSRRVDRKPGGDDQEDDEIEVDVRVQQHRHNFRRQNDTTEIRIRIPSLLRRAWRALEPVRTYMLLPLLQGIMLGLGQHGMRYLLSHFFSRRAVTSA